MSSLTFKVVDQFFDRPAVMRAVDKARRRNLSKAGSYVRRSARSSIRPAGKRRRKRKQQKKHRRGRDPTISQHGKPPRIHKKSGNNLRRIFFMWEATTKSVVVSPALFANSTGTKDVPGLLEHGGRGRVRRPGKKKRYRNARFAARPFMGPALEREAPKFPDIWRNSVRR